MYIQYIYIYVCVCVCVCVCVFSEGVTVLCYFSEVVTVLNCEGYFGNVMVTDYKLPYLKCNK